MPPPTLHEMVRQGGLSLVRAYFADLAQAQEDDINAYDPTGHTPLMHAVVSSKANVDLVRTLLEHGADVRQETNSEHRASRSVMALALSDGDPAKVRLLLQHGADIHYLREQGYRAIIDAVHGRDVLRDERLPDLLALLIASGVDLNAVTSYSESGLRVLSRLGRFDAVRLLLDAGADAEQLRWTPLLRAVALDSLADVRAEIDHAASLEDKDYWARTPWLLAIQTGDIDKARLLQAHGADIRAQGRCGKPPLFYAIENHYAPMLRWLIENGASIEGADEFGSTPLMTAAEHGDTAAVEILLKAGASVDARKEDGQSALSHTGTGEVALLLLQAGASPQELPFEARRSLLGFPSDPDLSLLTVSPEEFQAGRARRFGKANPEKITVPFWEGMIRAGVSGYQATTRFEGEMKWGREPVWCAQRFGQSLTFLPDGRIVQVAGEHEDSYDPDFCIYNDVFVHHPDGRIDLYGYPETVFPPTDFHTATLLGDDIYLIGSLGYPGERRYGVTPVYRLDIHSFRMEKITTSGEAPGWIYGHTAVGLSSAEIRVSGGKIVAWNGSEEAHTENVTAFVLRIKEGVWSIASPT